MADSPRLKGLELQPLHTGQGLTQVDHITAPVFRVKCSQTRLDIPSIKYEIGVKWEFWRSEKTIEKVVGEGWIASTNFMQAQNEEVKQEKMDTATIRRLRMRKCLRIQKSWL